MSRHEEMRRSKRAARQAEKKKRQRETRQKQLDARETIREAEHERHIAKEARRSGQSVDAVRDRYKDRPWCRHSPFPGDTE